jgi:hypothetical protein
MAEDRPLAHACGLAAGLALGLLGTCAEAWGLVGHKLVVERAALVLPGPLGALARAETERLKERSLDPDVAWRKECGREEGIQHFFDVDRYDADPRRIPRDLEVLRVRHGRAYVDDSGLLPWRIADMAECLRRALEEGDRDLALDLMGQLAHYTADLHMPFHLTSDYDGQSTGQQGIHFRYEDGLVGRNARELTRRLGQHRSPAVAATDPVEAAFTAMIGAPARVKKALAADRAAGRRVSVESAAYYRALWPRLSGQLTAELDAAGRFTAAIWLWAWEAAGRPDLGAPAPARPGAGRAPRRKITG